MLAEHPFHIVGHPNPHSSTDLPGDLDVPVGPLRMKAMILGTKLKKQLHALPANVPCLGRVILASHLSDSKLGIYSLLHPSYLHLKPIVGDGQIVF